MGRDANLTVPVPKLPCVSQADICLLRQICGFPSSRAQLEDDILILTKQMLLFAKGSAFSTFSQVCCRATPNAPWQFSFYQPPSSIRFHPLKFQHLLSSYLTSNFCTSQALPVQCSYLSPQICTPGLFPFLPQLAVEDLFQC